MEATGFGRCWITAFLGLALGLAGVACESREPGAPAPREDGGDVVLARVGDEAVTLEQLGGASPDAAQTTRRLEGLLSRKIASWEARRRGLADDPKVMEKIERVRRDAELKVDGLLRDALYNDIRLGLAFSEEELRAHYQSELKRHQERQWTLRIQRFVDEAQARAAAQELGTAGHLDPAQSQTIGPVPAAHLPRRLMTSLHELRQPGDRKLLDLDGSWSIVEVVEYQPAVQLPFEKVRDQVELNLGAIRARQQLAIELEKLRRGQVQLDTAAIERVSAEVREKQAAR